jgi:hypothetical protein
MESAYFEATIYALLSNGSEFTSVNLSGYNLEGDRASRLAIALEKNRYVNTLELHEVKGISEEGWSQLAKALPPQLHTLDLSECGLNENGVFEKYICEALKRTTCLVELDLSSNDISACESFLAALSGMESLSELLIQHNKFGSAGASRVVASISPKAPLERIWIQNNEISIESRADIQSQASSRSKEGSTLQIIFGN